MTTMHAVLRKEGEVWWGVTSANKDKLFLRDKRRAPGILLIGEVIQRGTKWGLRARRKQGGFGEDLNLTFDDKEEARRYLWVTTQLGK
jgi:hypothetical protein